ncbi:hypothetical protein FPC41_15635 [Marinobacter vulgaris]|nr:hypothetical protein FPC41_15635 [Marinobacter vulgaris]
MLQPAVMAALPVSHAGGDNRFLATAVSRFFVIMANECGKLRLSEATLDTKLRKLLADIEEHKWIATMKDSSPAKVNEANIPVSKARENEVFLLWVKGNNQPRVERRQKISQSFNVAV